MNLHKKNVSVTMETNKEIIRRILDQLPDDAPLENILHHLIQESKLILAQQKGRRLPLLSPDQVEELEKDLGRG